MFIRLGTLNVRRQIGRSVLALISMIAAAISLTTHLTLDSGYPAQAYCSYRDYFAGDLVIYPLRIMSSPDADAELELHRLLQDGFSTLTILYPHLTREGFLTAAPSQPGPLSLSAVSEAAAHPAIVNLTPLYRMPGIRYSQAGLELATSLRSLPPNDRLTPYLVEQVKPSDRLINVWINAHLPQGAPTPAPGEVMEISLPRIFLSADGAWQIDQTQLTRHEVYVAGYYSLPTRTVTWQDAQGNPLSEQGYLGLDEVWLSVADWIALWSEASDGLAPLPGSYAASVADMGSLEAVVGELQLVMPELTVVSVPSLAMRATRYGLLDHFQFAPSGLWQADARPQLGLPLNLGRLISLFIYLIAGLLMSARMLTGAAARRQEIGVLKALGARQRDILLMSLTEAVVLSLIGATIGFGLAYVPALFQQLSNRLALAVILDNLIGSFATVFLQTVAVGAVFGLLPALKLARMTVSEVLRQ